MVNGFVKKHYTTMTKFFVQLVVSQAAEATGEHHSCASVPHTATNLQWGESKTKDQRKHQASKDQKQAQMIIKNLPVFTLNF
jgi:hypothetical protein